VGKPNTRIIIRVAFGLCVLILWLIWALMCKNSTVVRFLQWLFEAGLMKGGLDRSVMMVLLSEKSSVITTMNGVLIRRITIK